MTDNEKLLELSAALSAEARNNLSQETKDAVKKAELTQSIENLDWAAVQTELSNQTLTAATLVQMIMRDPNWAAHIQIV